MSVVILREKVKFITNSENQVKCLEKIILQVVTSKEKSLNITRIKSIKNVRWSMKFDDDTTWVFSWNIPPGLNVLPPFSCFHQCFLQTPSLRWFCGFFSPLVLHQPSEQTEGGGLVSVQAETTVNHVNAICFQVFERDWRQVVVFLPVRLTVKASTLKVWFLFFYLLVKDENKSCKHEVTESKLRPVASLPFLQLKVSDRKQTDLQELWVRQFFADVVN